MLLDTHDAPDVLAGYVVAETARASQASALSDLLRDAGTFNALRFLATGEMSQSALRIHADQMISRPHVDVDSADLVDAFQSARVPTRPYAETLEGNDTLKERLRARDPYVAGIAPTIMSDNAWVTLQSICDS